MKISTSDVVSLMSQISVPFGNHSGGGYGGRGLVGIGIVRKKNRSKNKAARKARRKSR